jgi:hypothetical protein
LLYGAWKAALSTFITASVIKQKIYATDFMHYDLLLRLDHFSDPSPRRSIRIEGKRELHNKPESSRDD